MKKNMKRLAAFGLTAVVAAGAITGCKNQTGSDSQTTAGGQTDTADDVITIDWLAYDCYGQPDPESEVVKAVEEKYNVKFNFWYVDSQKWDDVLGAKLSSGEMPDIMKVRTSTNIPIYVKQGILAPFTEEMLAKIPETMKQLEELDTDGTAFTDAYYEGQLYELKVPSLGGTYPTVLVWRQDWLKNSGIDKMPSTIDEMEEALYAIRNNDPDGNGIKDTYGMSNTAMNAVFGAYGAIPLKEFRGTGAQSLFYTMKDGKIEFACIQPEMKEALAKLQQWYKDGVIDPEFITGENTGGYWAVSQAFDNGKVGVTGMALSQHWMPPKKEGESGNQCYASFAAANPGTKWGETIDIGPAIEGPEGKSGTHCWGAYGNSGYAFTTKAVKDPRKVEAILAIIEDRSTDDDFYMMTNYGIEGTHFSFNENNIPKRLEPYTKTSEYSKAGVGVFKVGFNGKVEKEVNAQSFEFFDQYKTNGYQDIPVPPVEAGNQYLTDLKTFTLDAYIKFITGEESIDKFDDFVEQFNSLGGQQIIDEINAEVAKTR
jgi:putative aldouronate transport system substrate-binding protein